MRDIFAKHRENIVSGLLILFSIGFLGFFRESAGLSPVFQGLVIAVIFFLVIPVLYCKIVLKRSLKDLGFRQGNTMAGILSLVVSVSIALCIIVGISHFFPAFRSGYAFPYLVERNFFWFLAYELFLVPLVALLYEVFFRGFIQFLWLRNNGFRAILIQGGLLFLLFFISRDLSWSNLPLLLFAPFAGFIAYRSQSLWYSLLASSLFFLLTDILLLILR